MAMGKYLKRYDEKIFENIFFEILSLPYFRKFSHSKISTYTVFCQTGSHISSSSTYF